MCILDFILFSTLAIGVALGNGEVNLLSVPPSIALRGHETVNSAIVSNILAASLGFTADPINNFQGMFYNDPWNFAKCLVTVDIRGPKTLSLTEGHSFPLQDTNTERILNAIEAKMYEHYPFSENQTVMEINLVDGREYVEMMMNKGKLPELKKLKVFYLDSKNDEDNVFINEILVWKACLEKMRETSPSEGSQPEVFWYNVRGLHAVMDIHGEHSLAAKEALDLVKSMMQKTKNVYEQLYGKKVLVLALTSDAVHTRRFRRAASETNDDRNLAVDYDENYPVIFNIFLWFTIAFIMSLIAISMVTACMDPGRDSIIYRMTSTRMKKDN